MRAGAFGLITIVLAACAVFSDRAAPASSWARCPSDFEITSGGGCASLGVKLIEDAGSE